MSLLEGGPQGEPTEQGTADWVGTLPEDLRTEEVLPTLNKFKTKEGEQLVNVPPSVLKSYIEAQKKINQKGVIIPGENATDAERADFFTALGRPESPEGYEFKPPEKLPSGVSFNQEKANAFAKLFHDFGIPKNQAQQIFNAYNEQVFTEAAENEKAVKEFQENSIKELRNEWGSEFEKKAARAAASAKTFGGKEYVDLMKATGLDFHPAVLKMHERITARIGEHFVTDGYVENAQAPITRDKLEQMMKDPRYSGNQSDRDPEYIKQIENGFKALAQEAAA